MDQAVEEISMATASDEGGTNGTVALLAYFLLPGSSVGCEPSFSGAVTSAAVAPAGGRIILPDPLLTG